MVSGASRAFGEIKAVSSATFTALPGTVTALIGPNGSGKTTLMLMLASLLKPDGGQIRIAGFDPILETGEVRRRLGWMPDVLGSWASLSVRATLEFTGRLYEFDRSKAAARAAELMTIVGLADLADSPTRVLSRGQKQRLSLARALVHDPDVLLLDEPASGLDPVARVQLRDTVRRMAAEGKTVLVSSHVLSELDEMADSAVYLEGGVTASAERVAAARIAPRPWRIRASDLAALLSALDAAEVGTRTQDRNEVVVALSGEEEASTLLATLVSAGVRISAFAPALGELENTFMDLSGLIARPVADSQNPAAS